MHPIALHLHKCTLHTTLVVLTILDLHMWIAYSFNNKSFTLFLSIWAVRMALLLLTLNVQQF